MLEDCRQVPERGKRSRGGVPQSRRLATNRQHVPRRGVGAKAEMMVAEGELLGVESAAEPSSDTVIIDNHFPAWDVASLITVEIGLGRRS